MIRARGGYTIVEVIIVLAITGVLFTSAVLVFQGQQGKTALSQTLYDMASQIQSYATQVGSGVYPDSQTYSCSISGTGRPVLDNSGSGGLGSNQDCLFLGRALQFVPGQGTLYAYTVLGTRDAHNGSTDLGTAATSFDQANPEPALDSDGNWLLTGTYALPSNMSFYSTQVTNQSGTVYKNYQLVGFYIDLSGATTATSTTALSTRGYNFQTSGSTNPNPAVKTCIEQGAVCSSSSYVAVRTWQICVQDGSTIGSVMVDTSPNGVTTRVDAQECA